MITQTQPAIIVFYPAFENQAQLTEHMLRASWYLSPLDNQLAHIIAVTKSAQTTLGPCPIHLAPETVRIAEKFGKLHIKQGNNLTIAELSQADYVFVHEEGRRNELISLKKSNNLNFSIVRVDYEEVQYSDSFYLRFSEQFPQLFDKYYTIAEERIQRLLRPLISERCYLFGTGPNFSLTKSFDFSDGLIVACNSMAINQDVVEQLDPDIFVIADPIFHAGPSSYAGIFRESFVKLLTQKTCPILVPMRDFHIYNTCFPGEIRERLIPIKFNLTPDGEGPNLNLLAAPYVTTTSNILTLFQIPIAATLAEEIYISGCDGRPLTHNNYFWKHDKSVQINDQMALIRQAHPAFFNISYDDYYEKHIHTLDRWLTSCEFAGKRVFNLTPSYIPALAERTIPELIQKLRSTAKPKVSVIIPLYNAAPYLEVAVHSILEDRLDGVEILIIDDFSDDNSLDVARQLAKRHPQVSVIQNFHAKGVSGARNTGIDLSVGEYVTFLDADDTLPLGSLQRRVQFLDTHPNTNIVHWKLEFIDENGSLLGVNVFSEKSINFSNVYGCPASFNTLMFRRNVIKNLRFDEGMTNGEDWLALAKILRMGNTSHPVPGGGANYRIHSGSTVKKDMLGHEEKLRQVIDWVYADLPDDGSYPTSLIKGLTKPSKESVLFGRRLSQIIWCIFSAKINTALALMTDTNFLNWLEKNPGNFDRTIEVAYVRFYSKHADTADTIPLKDKKKIADTLQNMRKIEEATRLVEAFDRKFRISAPATSAESVKRANHLFREQRYHEALAVYRKLRASGGIYTWLDANIRACEKQICSC